MPTENLTQTRVKAATAEPGTRLELWDEKAPGLCLRVTEKGVKSWILRYRSKHGGQPRFKLGDGSRMGLADARREAYRLKGEIAKGNEPAAVKQAAKAADEARTIRTFGDLLDAYEQACAVGEWKPKMKRKRQQTIDYEKLLTDRHIRPVLGARPYESIGRPDVKALLRRMRDGVETGDPTTERKPIGAQTNRVHAIIRQAFNFAIAEELVETNPAMGFQPLHHSVPRQRVWRDEELTKLWPLLKDPTNLKDSDGKAVHVSRPVAIALQLCAILLNRRAEVAGMQLSELNLDTATWTLESHRMKSGKPHQVALPPHAVTLIREAIKLAQGSDTTPPPVVFPSPRDKSVAIKPLSLTHAMGKLRSCIGVEGAHVHDLRRTGSSALTSERIGVSPHIRSQVLGHGSDAGGGAAVSAVYYDVNSYLNEKRRALEAWENLLLEIVGERMRPENVTPIREGAA